MTTRSSITPRTVSRRSFLAGVGVAGLGAAFGACGGPGAGNDPETGSGGTAGSGEVSGEINFYHWRGEDREVIDQLIASFAEQYPDAAVAQTIDPSEQYQSTAAQKARDGTIGDALTALRGAQFDQFVEQGIFTDLTDSGLAANYNDSLIEAGAADGAQYGLPYQLVFNAPLINMDLAEQAGLSEPPRDWDSYLAALEAFRGLGVEPFVWPGNDPANGFQIINSLAMNLLPEENAFAGMETGDYQATDDWWIEALTRFQELSGYFQENFAGAGTDGLLALFAQGQAAILPTGSYQIGQVRDAGAQFPIDLAPVMTNPDGEQPTYEGIHNATFILGINTQAQNPDGARAWLEFLSLPENAAVYANGTAQHVTVADVQYDNPDLEALSPWAERNTLLAPRFQFLNLDIRSAVENSLVAVATGATPEQAAVDAQAIIDQELA